jgi:hypothetical protein
MYKDLYKFTIDDFDDLCVDVCPTIIVNAMTKCEEDAPVGRPYKRNLVQRLFDLVHET